MCAYLKMINILNFKGLTFTTWFSTALPMLVLVLGSSYATFTLVRSNFKFQTRVLNLINLENPEFIVIFEFPNICLNFISEFTNLNSKFAVLSVNLT